MLAGVRVMATGSAEPVAELRLDGGRAVVVKGGDLAGIEDMVENGVHLWDGDLGAMAPEAERHGVDLPPVGEDGMVVGPDQGELFLVAVLSRYARSSGYTWAEAVSG